ncbi:MAG: hypothetical protein ACRBDL_05225 [Alphaproteobacteria bacterium]
MGALSTVLTTALIGGITQSAQSSQSLKQLEQQQALEERQLTQDANREKDRIALDASVAEQDRKDALKRSVARQRANFGAQGVGAGGGSSQAVLLGITEESEEEKVQREALDALKVKAVDEQVQQEKELNVLQREQLKEQSQVNGLTGLIGDLF